MATTETITRPAGFVEDIGKDLATQVVAQTAIPIVTTGVKDLGAGPTQYAFEKDEDFAKRRGLFEAQRTAALGFEQRQQALKGLAPQVAAQDKLQQQAQTLAQQGIGSYAPFLQQAQLASAAAVSPQIAEQFMSPYQQQVIDASLAEFDRNAAINRKRISDQAIASGAFGGGREGVMQSEYQLGSDRERALLQAGLLQQGYGQAQQLAAQRFNQQQGLAGILPGLQKQDVGTLGQLGALNQAQQQAELDAQREATRMATYQPQEQVDRYANIVTGIMGGYPGATQTTNVPNPTPLQTALGAGSTLAGIYGAVSGNFNPLNFLKN
jgi:hypothetical protein